jgi:hypothetical protein
MDNFEELRKKVEDYPNSSLFVPLAEEYKKRGELDEAINVLKRGLERQPSYTSARVSIAKIYLEKGMRAEAVVEFEKVVEVSPENFFAHKKLAETYCRLGRRDEAISQYNEVLKLNPEDEEAAEILQRLEGGGKCEAEGAPADMAAELEALSLPPGERAERQPSGADSTKVMGSPFEAADEEDAEVFDSASFVEDAPPFEEANMSGEGDEAWDMEDDDFDMGGLEFEPDGVFGDEDSGEVKERKTEAGLDIGVDVISGSDGAVPEADTGREAVEAEAFDQAVDSAGEMDILTAAEKVGHEILNEPLPVEPSLGRESLVPSGGVSGDSSKEYSGESFIGNDDQNVNVTPAPGLETFEAEAGEPENVPQEDRTVMMREPLAGMEEGFANDEQDIEAEGVPETAQVQEEKTVIMEAMDLEAMKPAFEAPVQEDEAVVYESEPFASLDDTRAFAPEGERESITAEAGTIDEEALQADSQLINDPFSGMPVDGSEALEPEVVEAEAVEPEVMEAEAVEPEVVEAEALEPEVMEAEALEPEVG